MHDRGRLLELALASAVRLMSVQCRQALCGWLCRWKDVARQLRSICCDMFLVKKGERTLASHGDPHTSRNGFFSSVQWKVQGGSPEGTLAWVRQKGCLPESH